MFQAASAQTRDKRLPEGARRIDPIRIEDWVSAGATKAHRLGAASIEIPPMPNVFLYSVLTQRGAQVGIASTVQFAPVEPTQAQLWINGQNVMSAWSLVSGNGGKLPDGTVVDLKAHHQFVEQFEFWTSQCLDSPDVALVRYHITAIGAPPKVVAISVADLTSSVEVVNSAVKWRIPLSLYYERLAGKSLTTTLKDMDTGMQVTRELWYESSLRDCNSLPAGSPR